MQYPLLSECLEICAEEWEVLLAAASDGWGRRKPNHGIACNRLESSGSHNTISNIHAINIGSVT